MSEFDYDLIVIGGSANGANAAIASAAKGINVAIIEKHKEIGIPEHCSGLFSYTGLEDIDSIPPENVVLNENIEGSRIIAPNGKVLTVRKGYKHAMVTDRALFDKFLVDKARQLGTEVLMPYKALTAERTQNGVQVQIKGADGEKSTLTSKMLISAEGIQGKIAQQMGLKTPDKSYVVNATHHYMKDVDDLDTTLVEVYQFQKYAKHFFGWVIPMDDNRAKIGLGTDLPNAGKQLEGMINEHPVLRERLKDAEIIHKTAGRIPITGPMKRTYADRFLMTGDVAGQTKPTTGGGVIIGGIAARIAGEVAANAIVENKTSSNDLKIYQKRWKKLTYSNLKLMGLVRNYMNKLKDEEVDQLFARLEEKNILADIEKYGDVDDQGPLVKKFMTTLSLYPFYLKTSGRLLKSLIQSI